MSIYETAKNYEKVMASPPVICSCGEKWFSPFDKLYVDAYGKCTSCSSEDEINKLSGDILNIIDIS